VTQPAIVQLSNEHFVFHDDLQGYSQSDATRGAACLHLCAVLFYTAPALTLESTWMACHRNHPLVLTLSTALI
jgi:hypothetical protein